MADKSSGYDSGETSSNSGKPFQAVVKNIERYLIDNKFILQKDSMLTMDAFDITLSLSASSRLLKCILHPTLNKFIYRNLIKVQSLIQVNKYELYFDETDLTVNNKTVILKEIEIVEYRFNNAHPPGKDTCLLITEYKRNVPLSTSRQYYLPLYNDEDCYGAIWTTHLKEMKTIKKSSLVSCTTIKDLHLNRSLNPQLLPVIGKVITKSRLSHFGKKTDSQGKYPYIFSMEIEENGWSCSVTFWNKVCLSYFRSIKVGQTVIIKNYRMKNRYGNRTNTVYEGLEAASFEISINTSRGDVDYIDEKDNFIPYRYYSLLYYIYIPLSTFLHPAILFHHSFLDSLFLVLVYHTYRHQTSFQCLIIIIQ